MNWHPLSERFPFLEGEEYQSFKDGIAGTKGIGEEPILFRVVDGEKQFLDGRNRLKACDDLGIKPAMKQVTVADDDVSDFIIRRNVSRRHLGKELRQTLAVEMRANGDSIRSIAETLGKSPGTIHKDLQDAEKPSGVQNRTPETQKVTGKDKKTYAAKGKKKPVLCSRCARVGIVKDCEACVLMRKVKSGKATLAEQTKAIADKDEAESDEPTIEDQIKAKNAELEGWCRDLMAFAETMPDDPWLQESNRRKGALEKLKNCCETIRSAKCHCACPKCSGVGCRQCHKTGRMTLYAFQQL